MPGAPAALQNIPDTGLVHGTTVAVGQRALLIVGPSGAGKSALALHLIALGARLVADDQTRLTETNGLVIASAPETIAGQIEARGLGILHVDAAPPTPLKAVLDLSQKESDRLPAPRDVEIFGTKVPLLHEPATAHFPSALFVYLGNERSA
ncbi:MAG: HPr kinase/phosphatase C-terminal domain-containing protein [Pseudomonadota bacterium]